MCAMRPVGHSEQSNFDMLESSYELIPSQETGLADAHHYA
jgi:hypothetical protein